MVRTKFNLPITNLPRLCGPAEFMIHAPSFSLGTTPHFRSQGSARIHLEGDKIEIVEFQSCDCTKVHRIWITPETEIQNLRVDSPLNSVISHRDTQSNFTAVTVWASMSLHVYDIIVSNGITRSSSRDLSLSLQTKTGAQSRGKGEEAGQRRRWRDDIRSFGGTVMEKNKEWHFHEGG